MRKKLYNWNDLDIYQVSMILETYTLHFKKIGISTSKERLLRILRLVSPIVIFEYENDNIKSFRFDSESLDFMRILSKNNN